MLRTDLSTDSPISEFPEWSRFDDRDAYQECIASGLEAAATEAGF